jgi:putative transposase
MREALGQFEICLLNYTITRNHVHLLVEAGNRFEVSGFIQKVAGEFARAYNCRKARMNAFWGDNFHATLVDTGDYLWRCLRYIDLNMVRCGVVAHPDEWEWGGYHEIMGTRQRYRLLDLPRLCWRLGTNSLEELRNVLKVSLAEAIARDDLKRQGCWTESLAVGKPSFLEGIKPLILSRQETEIVEEEPDFWVLKESEIPYGQKLGPKTSSKHLKFPPSQM